MNPVRYELRVGETPRMIARRFTGKPERWTELLAANPQAMKYYKPGFGYTFVPAWWSAGRAINLPTSWGVGVSGPLGQVGAGCTPTPVEPHPTAFYKVHGDMWESAAAAEFNQFKQTAGGTTVGNFDQLVGANAGWWTPGFYSDGAGCRMSAWKNGAIVRIPKSWLEGVPESQLKAMPAFAGGYIVTESGSKWTPVTTTPGGVTCPAGQYPHPTSGACLAPPQCPADMPNFNPLTWACEKKAGQQVGYEEEKKSGGLPTWGWILLAAGAGIGGALLLANLTKAKKVPVAGPGAKPPVKGEEEVVVRR